MDREVRGAGVLGAWYVAALLVPVVVGLAVVGPEFLMRRQSRDLPCADPGECGTWYPDASGVLALTTPVLLAGLVISGPLWFVLGRRVRSGLLAGSLAALVGLLAAGAGAVGLRLLG
ncbi:hypothetical protein QLQ12_43470 [Actinoplanes sp. NEAU-A12]|uniref:Integral membrane protein n=1 Tax=Actinoplanes sandaracinus TaxID=3045177 RepID=A0ABT6X0D2_9ACTN|nr:hypothetical protein [Actinoplanes sandaracinus]MDI6105465.1 hypothetical protein [Actinoplanes sandaracinus]